MTRSPTFNLSLLGLALAAALSSGCESRAVKAMRDQIDATNRVADILATVRDAKSAKESLATLDQGYSELAASIKYIVENQEQLKSARMLKVTADQLTDDVRAASARWVNELNRLKRTPGLGPEFWKVIRSHSFEIVGGSASLEGLSPAAQDYFRNVKALCEKYGYEKVVSLEFRNATSDPDIFERLQKLAPGAELYHVQLQMGQEVTIGPVKDFRGFLAKLDFATISYQDESRRGATIEILPGRPSRFTSPELEKSRAETAKIRAEAKDRQAKALKRMEEERLARERERKGPDPSDPDYCGKLADRMLSENSAYRSQAIDDLLKTDPASVSPETKKKVARAFKSLAEGSRFSERKKAVDGLVLWAGKFSVPILLKMLDQRHSLEEEAVLRGLAELKDSRAAPALASRLGDIRFSQLAYDALLEMGSDAEDAVIEIAPSGNANVCMAAINLLGSIGTEKSFEVLRKAEESRNRSIRLAAMAAVQKINKRSNDAKAKARAAKEAGQSAKEEQ
jgi:hypothetical protein